MDKALLGRPLQHALVVLWIVGLAQLLVALGRSAPTLDWSLSAALGALIALLVAERFRRVQLLPVSVVLAAGAVLGAAHAFGITAPHTLVTVLSVTALGLWQLSVLLGSGDVLQRVLLFLQPLSDDTQPWAKTAASLVHTTCMGLIALAFAAGVVVSVVWAGSVFHLPVLAICAIFAWLTAARYRKPWQAHTVVVVCAMIAVAIYLLIHGALSTQPAAAGDALRTVGSPRWLSFVFDASVALLLALLAVVAWVGSRLLHGSRNDPQPSAPGLAALYVEPLEHGAIAIALVVVVQLGLVVLAGAFVDASWSVAASLLVAAFALLAANHAAQRTAITPLGVFVALLGLCWIESAAMHGATPLALWPAGPASVAQWIALAVLGTATAWLAARLRASGSWQRYTPSLRAGAVAIVLWSFAGGCALLLAQQTWAAALFVLLILAAVAPAGKIRQVEVLRSVAIVIFASCMWTALIGWPTVARLAWPLLALWAFALWAIAHTALVPFNRRWPASAIAPAGLAWFGLAIVAAGAVAGFSLAATSFGIAASLLALAAYTFCMTRDSSWIGFGRLSATLLAAAGWATIVIRHLPGLLALDEASIGALAAQMLLWGNGVLFAMHAWNRYRLRFAERFAWRVPDMRGAILSWLLGLVTICIVVAAAWAMLHWSSSRPLQAALQVPVWLTLLFVLTTLHIYVYVRHALVANVLVLSLLVAANALWSSVLGTSPAVMLASCCALLAYFMAPQRVGGTFAQPILAAAAAWLPALAVGAIVVAALVPRSSDMDRALSVALVGLVAGWHGTWHADRRWLYAAVAAVVALVHVAWPVWLPGAAYRAQLPWFVAQLAVLAWLAARWANTRRPAFGNLVCDVLAGVWPWVAGLALVEWVVQLGATVLHLLSIGSPTVDQAVGNANSIAAISGHVAAMLGIGLLTWLCIQRVRQSGVDAWMYLCVALAGSVALYIRLMFFGLSPLWAADTAVIIVSSYALFSLQHMFESRALRRLTMVVPLLAIATVPFQLGSAHAALTLLAIGTLYLLARRRTGSGTPLYLGLLAMNAAVYLWVPQWSSEVGLVQIYVFPAALSVLWLLHLHRHELKPAVLSSARLAALATLYAAAGADVFLQDNIAVFVLGLGLGIVGIALGIGLRIRAFLYAGVAFLVLNVIGQLLVFYPEHRLARAAILMGVGVSVTGLMVWFSLKREVVLERVRLIRSDLDDWT